MTIIIVIFFFRSTNHLCRLPPCPRSRPGGTVRCWCPRSCGTGTCRAAPPGTPTPSRRQTENITVRSSILTYCDENTELPVRTACTRRGRACWRAPGATPAGPPSPRRAANPRPGCRKIYLFLLIFAGFIFFYLSTTLLLLARAGAVPHARHAGVQPEQIHWQWSRRQREQ